MAKARYKIQVKEGTSTTVLMASVDNGPFEPIGVYPTYDEAYEEKWRREILDSLDTDFWDKLF